MASWEHYRLRTQSLTWIEFWMNEGPSFVTRIVWQEGKLGTKLINSIIQLSLTPAFIHLLSSPSIRAVQQTGRVTASVPHLQSLSVSRVKTWAREAKYRVIRKPIINSIFGNIYHIGVDIDKAYLVNIAPEYWSLNFLFAFYRPLLNW